MLVKGRDTTVKTAGGVTFPVVSNRGHNMLFDQVHNSRNHAHMTPIKA